MPLAGACRCGCCRPRRARRWSPAPPTVPTCPPLPLPQSRTWTWCLRTHDWTGPGLTIMTRWRWQSSGHHQLAACVPQGRLSTGSGAVAAVALTITTLRHSALSASMFFVCMLYTRWPANKKMRFTIGKQGWESVPGHLYSIFNSCRGTLCSAADYRCLDCTHLTPVCDAALSGVDWVRAAVR